MTMKRSIRSATPAGLGSLRHTMPHLKRSAPRMASGGDITDIYQAMRPSKYKPGQLSKAVMAAGRRKATEFTNPEFAAFPGSTSRALAEGGPAVEEPPLTEFEDGGGMDGEDTLPEGEGGEDTEQQRIVLEALMALEGRHPDPEKALEAFVAAFGEEALAELRELVKGQGDERESPPPVPEEDVPIPEESMPEPEPDEQLAAAGGGLLRGKGSGQSDEIEASTPSGRPVLLSDGEYVIDAPTVSAIGDGSTAAGARRLDDFRRQVRKQAYGHDKQAKPMKKGGITVRIGS